jgi:hypothetical protein
VGGGATTALALTTSPSSSSSSSSSSRASEKLPGSGIPFVSMPVPRPVLEPSSWASSSSAAVRTGERRGVWAVEEERLEAAFVRACVRAESAWIHSCYVRVRMACTQRKGRGGRGSEVGMRKQRHIREAAGRVRGNGLKRQLRLTSDSSFSSVNVWVASS